MSSNIVVAIPAKNEAERIGRAIDAIAAATPECGGVEVVVLANNCTDGTVAVALEHGRRRNLPVNVLQCWLPPRWNSAGRARCLVMQKAAARCTSDGVLVSTDADAVISAGTLAAIEEAVGGGADLVCGGISTTLPPEIARSPSIRRIDSATAPYLDLVHDVRFSIDLLYAVQPEGPRPHYIESGACVALTADLFRRIGGLPDIPVSEDRALVRAAEAAGARIFYSDAAHARVSARTSGRAEGGMAAAIRARLADPDPFADQALVSPDDLRDEWYRALDLLPFGRRPAPGTATHPLRASDLERYLPALRSFVAESVGPAMAAHASAPADSTRQVA